MRAGLGLLDTGPLVSFLASGLRHHTWAGCAMETPTPSAAHMRTRPHRGSLSPEAGGSRRRCSICTAGAGSDSYCARRSGGTTGSARANATVSEHAHVTGRRVCGSTLQNSHVCRSSYPGLRFLHPPASWQPGHTGPDARLKQNPREQSAACKPTHSQLSECSVHAVTVFKSSSTAANWTEPRAAVIAMPNAPPGLPASS